MTGSNPNVPGVFCWAEVVTTDMAAARAFYAELFGWSAEDVPAGEHGTYTMFKLGGASVGGGYAHGEQEQAAGVPPHWNCYVAVESADAVVEKAAGLGGQVIVPAFDVMDSGRMAVIADPDGAAFQVWEPKSHAGSAVSGVHGSPCWNELLTRDREATEAFYTGLFGWSTKAMDMGPGGVYTIFEQGERMVAGCMTMPAEIPAMVPSHWLIYFQVDDCDASAARCKELGGTLVAGPMDIPDMGRFAVLSDPQGPTFAVMQFAQPC